MPSERDARMAAMYLCPREEPPCGWPIDPKINADREGHRTYRCPHCGARLRRGPGEQDPWELTGEVQPLWDGTTHQG